MKKHFTFVVLFCLTTFVYAQNISEELVDRLVRYASIYTQSDYNGADIPSSQQQFDLANVLADELKGFGVKDVTVDEHSYVYATIPGNVQNAPKLFLSAHLDTSPDLDLEDKTPIPIVHEYNGGDLVINEKSNLILTDEKNKFLKDAIGGKVITSDGTTLLGADDKAGISIIMTLAETLSKNPSIPHGDIKIVFTPDEEIGNSTTYLDKENLDADFGLVFDSHGFGRIVVENFNAVDFTFTIKTPSAGHPGYSSNVPALNIANYFTSKFPERLASFNSTGKEGYIGYHKIKKQSNNEYVVYGRLRSFSLKEINRYKDKLKRWALKTVKNYDMSYTETNNDDVVRSYGDGPALAVLNIKDSYFNAKEILKNYPTNFTLIKRAYKIAGVQINPEAGRGGSDACDITYKGIPTYNIFTGSHNEHSQDEWASSKQMSASYNVALNYITLMAEQNRDTMLKEGKSSKDISQNLNIEIDVDEMYQKILKSYGNSFSNF